MSMSVRHRKGHIDVTTRNARIIKQLALCMCAVALFCAGFVVRGNHDLMSRLGIEEPETKAAVQAASADSGEVASRLNEVEGILAKSSSIPTIPMPARLRFWIRSCNPRTTPSRATIPPIAIRTMST